MHWGDHGDTWGQYGGRSRYDRARGRVDVAQVLSRVADLQRLVDALVGRVVVVEASTAGYGAMAGRLDDDPVCVATSISLI
jgi:hypothetical protein